MRLIIITLLLIPFLGVSQITIYEHSNFSGASKNIVGSWNAESWNSTWNDKISSISVPAGYQVLVYEHSNYGGKVKVLKGNWTATIAKEFWNDRISSIEIIPELHTEETSVQFFEHCRYEGQHLNLTGNWSVSDVGDFWNDRISSIVVPNGWVVILYEHSNYKGNRIVVNKSGDVGSFWNDKVSSIRVLAPGSYD